MANLTRLSVLIGEADVDRSRETAALLVELGVRHVVQVHALSSLWEALGKQAFDVLICAEQLGGEDGVAVLRAARSTAPATRGVLMRRNDRAGEFVPDDIEAIELPFSRLKLQGLLHRTAAPQGGLWCEVPDLSLTDILQMYHQARRSITVLLSGPIAGRIWLEAGDIVDAEANGERGMYALSLLLEAESGLIRTEPPSGPVSRSISAPFQSVILEAAHKLDERRRDSMISGPPGAAFSAGGFGAGAAGSSYPGASGESGRERPSLAGSVLRPAMTPPLEAPAPSPEKFLMRESRRHQPSWVAVLGLLLGLAVAGAVASFIKQRAGSFERGSADDSAEIAANPPAANPPGANPPAANVPPAVDIDEPSAAPAIAAPPAGVARSEPPPRGEAAEREPSATEALTPPPAPAAGRRAPGRANSSFELVITSKPPRASVYEGNRVLGKTPLRLTISKASLAGGPREFILRLSGYLPVKLSQAASESDVDAAIVLSPRPAVVDAPDGGLYESEADGDATGSRAGNSKARRRDLGIRLRR